MRAIGPLLIAVTAGILQGCVSAKPIRTFPVLEPIRVSDAPRTIAITRVVAGMPKGTVTGAVQSGLACGGQRKLEWSQAGQLASGAEQFYTDRIRDEFRGAGYRVAPTASETTSGLALFQDPQSSADFLMAAVIKDVAWNFCYPYAGFGNLNSSSGEASVEIEWHLYDPHAKAILFATTTGGTGKSDTQTRGGLEALLGAVGMAARNLLAEQELAFYLTAGHKELERTPVNPVAAPDGLPSLAGGWRAEGPGRLELTEITGGQISWEYESRDGGYGYRMRGTGHVDGDRLELTGIYVAGDGYSVNKPYTLSLRRDGQQLVGISIGALNKPRPLRFSKEP